MATPLKRLHNYFHDINNKKHLTLYPRTSGFRVKDEIDSSNFSFYTNNEGDCFCIDKLTPYQMIELRANEKITNISIDDNFLFLTIESGSKYKLLMSELGEGKYPNKNNYFLLKRIEDDFFDVDEKIATLTQFDKSKLPLRSLKNYYIHSYLVTLFEDGRIALIERSTDSFSQLNIDKKVSDLIADDNFISFTLENGNKYKLLVSQLDEEYNEIAKDIADICAFKNSFVILKKDGDVYVNGIWNSCFGRYIPGYSETNKYDTITIPILLKIESLFHIAEILIDEEKIIAINETGKTHILPHKNSVKLIN